MQTFSQIQATTLRGYIDGHETFDVPQQEQHHYSSMAPRNPVNQSQCFSRLALSILILFKIFPCGTVGQIMETHRLRLSRDLMIAMILAMGKSSVERGHKATACTGRCSCIAQLLMSQLQRSEICDYKIYLKCVNVDIGYAQKSSHGIEEAK